MNRRLTDKVAFVINYANVKDSILDLLDAARAQKDRSILESASDERGAKRFRRRPFAVLIAEAMRICNPEFGSAPMKQAKWKYAFVYFQIRDANLAHPLMSVVPSPNFASDRELLN